MSKMRAMIVPKPGGRLRMEERDLPEPSRHEVRIRIHACRVCHSDSITVEGRVPGLSYPRIPGQEVIGVIDAPRSERGRLGRGRAGRSTRDGGYATHMLALASALAHVPETLDPVESAPLLCAGITTFNALRNCGAKPGDLVAVDLATWAYDSPPGRGSGPCHSASSAPA
jgi:D-arabinose 1-dehydrogenase-like Zn-dependent alcohol dehydrogenase